MLNWVIHTRSTHIGEDFEEAKTVLAEFATKPAKDIWNFPFEVQTQINEVNNRIKLGEKNITLNSTLTLAIEKGVEAKFNKIIDRLRNYYNL